MASLGSSGIRVIFSWLVSHTNLRRRNVISSSRTRLRYVNCNAGLVIIRESRMTVFLLSAGRGLTHFVDSSRSAICHGNSTHGIGAGISIPRTLWSAVPPGVFCLLVSPFSLCRFISCSFRRVWMHIHGCDCAALAPLASRAPTKYKTFYL